MPNKLRVDEGDGDICELLLPPEHFADELLYQWKQQQVEEAEDTWPTAPPVTGERPHLSPEVDLCAGEEEEESQEGGDSETNVPASATNEDDEVQTSIVEEAEDTWRTAPPATAERPHPSPEVDLWAGQEEEESQEGGDSDEELTPAGQASVDDNDTFMAQTQSAPPAASNVPASEQHQQPMEQYQQQQQPNDEDYFEEIEGGRFRKDDGREMATFRCTCCPATPEIWGHKIVGWKNPNKFRVSAKEFKKSCMDHVRSKNGRHRCWETVDKVHKMISSRNGIPSQEDLKNLATIGEILGKYEKYQKYWTDAGNTVSVQEKAGVEDKFKEAQLVYEYLLKNFREEIDEQLKFRKENKAAVRKKRCGPGGGSGGLGASGEESAGESGVGESGGGVSTLSLLREKRRRCEEELRKIVLRCAEEEKKESEGSAKGGSSSRGARGSARGGNSCVEEGDPGGQKEENGVLKLLEACKEDLYAWPIAAQELAEQSETDTLSALSALSLSHERAGEEGVVYPLLVVTVMQQSKRDSSWERVAARRVGSDFTDFRLYAVTQDQIIRVTVRHLSRTGNISFKHMYVDDKGVESYVNDNGVEEDPTNWQLVELKSGRSIHAPQLFKLETAEEECSWAITDDAGETVLELHFVTIQKWETTQAGKCAAPHA